MKVRGATPLVLAALALGACTPSGGSEKTGSEESDESASRFVNRMAGVPQPPPPAKPFQQSEKTDVLEFAYAWPAPAEQVPELASKFRRAMTAAKADALKMARDDQKAAKDAGYPFRPHSLETRWTVTADTTRFLALKSETYAYTGGAHGMTGYGALLWDKARNRETSIQATMTSPDAFSAANRDRFCTALDKAREEKRGAPVKRGADDFSKCIDPMKEVLVPTSRDGKLIDGVTVIVAPYSAGPYAEGSYEIALPMDASTYKTIKTEYQDAFVSK